MHAEEFMTREPAPCAPNDPLAAAARTMRDRSAGALAVVEEGRGVGLVTDRPLAVRGLAEENPYRRVRDVRTRDPVRLEPDDPLSRGWTSRTAPGSSGGSPWSTRGSGSWGS